MIADTAYKTVAVVRAVGSGYQADTHEFQITPQNTALIDAVVPVKANLSSLGGPAHGTVDDCVIQEIDIKTGQLLWSWHALQHVPLRASYSPAHRLAAVGLLPSELDPAAPGRQPPDLGSEHLGGVRDRQDDAGEVVWTLGGRRSDFKLGARAKFEWQHDARLSGSTSEPIRRCL